MSRSGKDNPPPENSRRTAQDGERPAARAEIEPRSRDTSARPPPDAAKAPDPGVPERVGSYRILERLGKGGMGTVFLAEQTSPVRRRVALKVVRSAFLDASGRIRFEAERQAMATLQHPNVAQIFEAGTTEEGHPYFAMEHVDGDMITTYCNRQQLSIQERLGVFMEVCAGVHHAHQKGIIHRDLKPSNILIAEIGEHAIPKIIDFGIAKILDSPSSEADLLTGDRLVGTPAYLSPEAANIGADDVDVDTRSDVYSLGILLYELLVGYRPFDDTGANVLQVLRRRTVEEPTEPSRKWSRLDVSSRDTVAAERRTDSATLHGSIRGDLDWIVLKAIARKRQDRYGSAAELAADIRRHLGHEPVEASPPSTFYRMQKFARRRLGTVVSALLVVLALSAGFIARTLEARRANREAAAAIEARRETERALEEAQRARAEADEISRFLSSLFKVSDPGEAKGNTVTARELLDAGAEEIRTSLADQPLARARFSQTIADVYRKLGIYDKAQEQYEKTLRLRREHLSENHVDIAETLNGLAVLHAQTGRFQEAEPLFRQALAIRERALGPRNPDTALSLNNLANLLTDAGRTEEAEPLYVRSVAIIESHEGPPGPDLLVVLNNLGSLYSDQGRYQEAEPLLFSFVDHQRATHGPWHPHVAIALANLAEVHQGLGELEEAEVLYGEALTILEKVLGPDHPEVAYCLSSMASLHAKQGRYGEAEPLFRRALAIQEATLPVEHPERQATVRGLGLLPP